MQIGNISLFLSIVTFVFGLNVRASTCAAELLDGSINVKQYDRKISLSEFLKNLNAMEGVKPFVEANRDATTLDHERLVEIHEFENSPSLSRLSVLLSNLLPAGSRFKQIPSGRWISVEPTATDQNATIGYSDGGFYIAGETGERREFRTAFYVMPFKKDMQPGEFTQSIVNVSFNRDTVQWSWRLRILLKDKTPDIKNPKEFVYQELNLFYDYSKRLRLVVVRNKEAGVFSKWRTQAIEIPNELIVPSSWVENHWPWLSEPVEPAY